MSVRESFFVLRMAFAHRSLLIAMEPVGHHNHILVKQKIIKIYFYKRYKRIEYLYFTLLTDYRDAVIKYGL